MPQTDENFGSLTEPRGGTKIVKDIMPGTNSGISGNSFTVYNNRLYFFANDGVTGNELWVTDGTTAGTQLLKDINTGIFSGISDPDFTEYNGKLYFRASDNIYGSELWTTDGTTAGTQLVKDIKLGTSGSGPGWFFIYNNKLFFVALNFDLWVTDGTSEGTTEIKPDGGLSLPLSGSTQYFTVYDNALYFAAKYTTAGKELWKLTDLSLSASEQTAINQTKIYPNPAKEVLNVKFPDNQVYDIAVYTSSGKLLATYQKVRKDFQVPVAKFPEGLYFITLKDEKGNTVSLKFIKNN